MTPSSIQNNSHRSTSSRFSVNVRYILGMGVIGLIVGEGLSWLVPSLGSVHEVSGCGFWLGATLGITDVIWGAFKKNADR